MPHQHAAIKAIRQAKRHRKLNDARRRTVEILARQYHAALQRHAVDDARSLLVKLVKAVDKAAQRHVLPKNAAARMKSRLMRPTPKA